jgi:hypothetical protein
VGVGVDVCCAGGGDRDEFEVDRGEVGDDSVEVCGVTDVADEVGHAARLAVSGGGDREVVEERPQQAITRSASQHDLVGGRFGHGPMVKAGGTRRPRTIGHLTRVRSVTVRAPRFADDVGSTP